MECPFSRMKIVLLGGNGMLGSMFHFVGAKAHNILCITRNLFDVEKDSVEKLKEFVSEDCVFVNCIGAIPQKKPSDKVYELCNEIFPQKLAEFCETNNIPLLHISTNCVFSGKKPYCLENDNPDAEDVYGQTKAKGEPSTAVVLRCSIIGFEKSVEQYGLLGWYCQTKDSVKGFSDHFWNGLTTYELSKTILGILEKKEFTPRLEHHYSRNTLSKAELLEVIAKFCPKPSHITPVQQGVKHYTLGSLYEHTCHPTLEQQINELFLIEKEFRSFHSQ